MIRFLTLATLCLLLVAPSSAQKSSRKTTKIEVVQFPTIPAEAAKRIAFNLHADPAFLPWRTCGAMAATWTCSSPVGSA